nr:hypothetical protein [Enterococcus cecorum]
MHRVSLAIHKDGHENQQIDMHLVGKDLYQCQYQLGKNAGLYYYSFEIIYQKMDKLVASIMVRMSLEVSAKFMIVLRLYGIIN